VNLLLTAAIPYVPYVSTNMRDRSGRDESKASRWAILGVVAAVHGALLLLALHWVVRGGARHDESWVFLVLPNRNAATSHPVPAEPIPPKKKPAATPESRLTPRPAPAPAPAQAAASEKPAQIDWNAEADLTVKRQAELAEAPQARALDRHGAGIDLNGGLGSDHRKKSEFAWDKKHTQRVEVVPGAVIVRVSDHCIVVFFPWPMAFCGIGKIPVRGDLLDHMRDEPQADFNQKNIAP
jgi:hypothetical protein